LPGKGTYSEEEGCAQQLRQGNEKRGLKGSGRAEMVWSVKFRKGDWPSRRTSPALERHEGEGNPLKRPQSLEEENVGKVHGPVPAAGAWERTGEYMEI